MAACLSGALLSKDASPFAGTAGGPPGTGQCFMAFDPSAFSNDFGTRIADLATAITDQSGARLPGARRFDNRQKIEREGVFVDQELISRIRNY